jgi:hypothetical protein
MQMKRSVMDVDVDVRSTQALENRSLARNLLGLVEENRKQMPRGSDMFGFD